MLIEEIVSKQNLKEFKKLQYDPAKVKGVKHDNVDYIWDKDTTTFTQKATGKLVSPNSQLFVDLLKHPLNKPALGKTGMGTKIGKALGMTGIGMNSRKPHKGGLAYKTADIGLGALGRGMDNLVSMGAGFGKGLVKGYRDRKAQNDAVPGQVDAYDYQKTKKWQNGDVDDREQIPLSPTQRIANPNFGKTVGKDHMRYKNNNGKLVATGKKTMPNTFAYGQADFQFVDKDPEKQNKNNPADDYDNLQILVNKGSITKDEGNEILQIANNNKIHLNKAFKIWQNETGKRF
jgi:hypothetical protein